MLQSPPPLTRKLQLSLLGLALAGFAVLLFYFLISDGYSDAGDGILHFQIAKYSWKHPELLLHHWGKPFYILACSPFAQFGYAGAVVFNLLCAAATAWCAAQVVVKLGYRFSGITLLFCIFCPLYFTVAISGLTEPFFGFILALSVLLAMKNKSGWAALLVSFLPFVRSEGFLLLPLFGILFLLRRKGLAFALLAAGTFIYSLAGGMATGDFLWLVHQNPYTGEDLYGRGSIFHFAANNEALLGTAGVLLFVAAGTWTLFRIFRWKKQQNLFAEELLLVYGTFLVYFVAHSIFWAYGLFGSLGLLRVMAAVTPMAAIAIAGLLHFWQEKSRKLFWLPGLAALLGLSLNVVQTLRQSRLPFHIDNALYPAAEAGKWMKTHPAPGAVLFCHHPFLVFLSERDPFDRGQVRNLWDMQAEKSGGVLRSGSLVVWDSHFGPMEGRLPLENLLNDPAFEKLFEAKSPQEEFRTAGKAEVPAVYIFRVK